jgi:hypothetical protein
VGTSGLARRKLSKLDGMAYDDAMSSLQTANVCALVLDIEPNIPGMTINIAPSHGPLIAACFCNQTIHFLRAKLNIRGRVSAFTVCQTWKIQFSTRYRLRLVLQLNLHSSVRSIRVDHCRAAYQFARRRVRGGPAQPPRLSEVRRVRDESSHQYKQVTEYFSDIFFHHFF